MPSGESVALAGEAGSAPRGAHRRRPDLIYFALAGFDLVTIVLTLMLGNHIMSLYEQSVARSVAWSARVVSLVEVLQAAQEVNAPGNDVFRSLDPIGERARRDEALRRYELQRDSVVAELTRNVPSEGHWTIRTPLGRADREMRIMVEQSDTIFSAVENGDHAHASRYMSEMDRTYARLSNHLLQAVNAVQAVEDENLAKQVGIARSLHMLGFAVLGLISLIVVGVALYGRHLGAIMRGAELALAAANEALEHYADNVAHELRTPISRMLVNAEITLSRPRDNDEYQDALASVMEDGQHLADIVASLLFLARAQRGGVDLDRQNLDICAELELIRSYFEASAQEAGLRLTVDCAAGATLRADRALLQRAISNLVANAISHTPTGGRVTIGAVTGDGYTSIEVSDTGEGMPRDVQTRVFDRFYRADAARATSSGRLGLGLPITKSIVDLHGGQILITSLPNAGAKVSIRLAIEPYERVIAL